MSNKTKRLTSPQHEMPWFTNNVRKRRKKNKKAKESRKKNR